MLKDKQTISLHGISMGMHRYDDKVFLTFKATGKLTHKDYESIIPFIDSSLKGVKLSKVDILVDLSEFDGWELRAAWDDFSIGLNHGFDFEKIAIYPNQASWIEYSVKISSWFMGGEIKIFDTHKEALTWIQEKTN